MHEGLSRPEPAAFPHRQELVQRAAAEVVADSVAAYEGSTTRPLCEPLVGSEFTAPGPRGKRQDVVAPAPAERPAAKPEPPEAAVADVPAVAAGQSAPEPKPAALPSEKASADQPVQRQIRDRPLPPKPLEQAARPVSEATPTDHTEHTATVEELPTVTVVETTDGGRAALREATPEEHMATLQRVECWKEVVQDTIPEERRFVSPEMDAFFEAKGLQTSPVYVLDRADIDTLREELGKAGYAHYKLAQIGAEGGSDGTHFPELGISIVDNSLAEDELTLHWGVAHEMAHATNRHNDLILQIFPEGKTNVYYERIGHILPVMRTGAFFEEAFAESMTAEYTREGLHLPNGRWGDVATLYFEEGINLPSVYVQRDPQGEVWIGESAYPAFALDLLKQVIPTLSDSLVLARSSIQGVEEVEEAITGLLPGLYEQLEKLWPRLENFQKGLLLVKRALIKTAFDSKFQNSLH